jgi:hypothetical protein
MPLKKQNNLNSKVVKDGPERRRFARAAKNLAIKLEDKEVDFVTETKNISCIGAYCQIDTYLPVLTKLKITLLLPKEKNAKTPKHVSCEGTVVRIEKCADALENNKYNIAVYFNQISKPDMKLIDRYVKTHLDPRGPVL